jgi:hypothetical protein
MINLKALEAAITKVEKLREHELTFEVGETTITLRPLAPEEETEVQKYAQSAWENANDEDGDQAAVSDFMDRLRHASLGYSIVQIGELDLRDTEYLETDEHTADGRPVVIPKDEAIRNLVANQWTRVMLTQVFAKFAELLERMENRATQNVVFDPVDLESEIERMEARLHDLKEALVESQEQKQDAVTKQQKAVAEMGRTNLGRPKEVPQAEAAPAPQGAPQPQQPPAPAVQPKAPQDPPAPPQNPPQSRQRVMPDKVSAPERQERPPEPEQPPQPEYHPLDPRQHRLTETQDSFFDPGDPDAEQMIAAESRRQAALRAQHKERERLQKEHEEQMKEAGIDPRPAPPQPPSRAPAGGANRLDSRTGALRSAANTSRQVFDTNANSVTRPPQQTQAKIGGVPVFRREAEVIENRGRGASAEHQAAPEKPVINPAGGSQNPRFRGPGQQ